MTSQLSPRPLIFVTVFSQLTAWVHSHCPFLLSLSFGLYSQFTFFSLNKFNYATTHNRPSSYKLFFNFASSTCPSCIKEYTIESPCFRFRLQYLPLKHLIVHTIGRLAMAPAHKTGSRCQGLGNSEYMEDLSDPESPSIQANNRKTRKMKKASKETRSGSSMASVSKLPRVKAKPFETESELSESSKVLDQYFVFRASSNSVMLLAPVESLQCNHRYNNKKVLGFIRTQGTSFPLMLALPGWKTCAEAHDRLLDSELWSERVHQFAEHVGHQFRTDGFDLLHNKKVGLSHASHVECKLMLWFAHHIYARRIKEEVNFRKLICLHSLKSTIEADIVVSEEPCKQCKTFKNLIEWYTGLKFTFKVCSNLGLLQSYRDANGRKSYPRFAYDESEPDVSSLVEEEDEEEHIYPLQPRSPNIMVVIKSHAGSSTNAQISQTQLSSIKKQNISSSRTPKQIRKKRQYEDSEDEKDYQGPQRKTPVKDKCSPKPQTRAGIMTTMGLVSPGPSPGSRYSNGSGEYASTGRGEMDKGTCRSKHSSSKRSNGPKLKG